MARVSYEITCSFTHHPLTNHTRLYSPAAEHHRPLAGTHCTHPQRDGQAELTWLAEIRHRKFNPGHGPSTNRARRRITSLIENNALPLSQTAMHARSGLWPRWVRTPLRLFSGNDADPPKCQALLVADTRLRHGGELCGRRAGVPRRSIIDLRGRRRSTWPEPEVFFPVIALPIHQRIHRRNCRIERRAAYRLNRTEDPLKNIG